MWCDLIRDTPLTTLYHNGHATCEVTYLNFWPAGLIFQVDPVLNATYPCSHLHVVAWGVRQFTVVLERQAIYYCIIIGGVLFGVTSPFVIAVTVLTCDTLRGVMWGGQRAWGVLFCVCPACSRFWGNSCGGSSPPVPEDAPLLVHVVPVAPATHYVALGVHPAHRHQSLRQGILGYWVAE